MAPETPGRDDRDHVREPFFWLFVIVAVIVAVLVLTNRSTDSVEASFETADTAAPTPAEAPEQLPTPSPTPIPEVVSVVVQVNYSSEAIAMSGSVPAQEVADALEAAAATLVAPDAVDTTFSIEDDTSISGAVLVLSGVVDDDDERSTVIDAFSNLGLAVDDQLVLAGSDASIADVLASDPELSQIADFLNAAGLLDELAQPSEAGITLFAPTNAAVTGLDDIALDELSDADELAGLLSYHVVVGRSTERELRELGAVSSRQGESIALEVVDGELRVGGAALVAADIDATNGIVHVVDAVLLPGTLRTEVALNELVTLDPILFASGSAVILEESFPILDSAADVLRANPLGRVEIQGHTDTDGPAEVNLELSQQRADAVRDYLVGQGIDEARLAATGFGETELKVDPEESEDDKAANRRIEFRVG